MATAVTCDLRQLHTRLLQHTLTHNSIRARDLRGVDDGA